MFSLLHEYLVDNKSLYLQGTGTLVLERHPASYDVANQQLRPPQTSIILDRNGRNEDFLFRFISQRLNITAERSQEIFQAFCEKLSSDLADHGKVNWHNLGSFEKGDDDKLVFHADSKISSLFSAVPAVRVIRQGSNHNMVVGSRETTSVQMQEYLTEQAAFKPANRWWIPAIVLGVITIALILLKRFHYL